MLDLTSLQLFVRAAELGSLSKVAERSNLALAAVSRRLSLLEAHYGVALLHRTTRGVSVTPAGAVLLARSQSIFHEVALAAAQVSDYAKGLRGSINFSVSTSAISQFLPADLARFGTAHEGIRLNIREAYSSTIIEQVRAGAADLGVIVGQVPSHGFRAWPYRRDRLAIIAPAAFRPEIELATFAEIADEDLVQMGFNTATTQLLSDAAAQIGSALRLRVAVDSFDAVCRMIQSGFGIGILPLDAASGILASLDLRAIALDEPWAERQMHLCASAESELGGPVVQLLDFLRVGPELISSAAAA